jgi:hypothetical protein
MTLSPVPPKLLGEELHTESGRHEPILKATVLFVALLMLCAALRAAAAPRLAFLCSARRAAPGNPTGTWAGSLPLLCATATEATARFSAQVRARLNSFPVPRCWGFTWGCGGRSGWGGCCAGRGLHAPLPTSEEDPRSWTGESRSQDGGAGAASGASSEAKLQAWLAFRKGKRAISQHAWSSRSGEA